MCGRFSFDPGDDFYHRFGVSNHLEYLPKKSDVSPGESIPIVFRQGSNFAQFMKWGLIPFWAKDSSLGAKMFNARAETIVDKPSFRKAFKTQRCLVPANGFYEWKTSGTKKFPYYFDIENRPLFAFAGLYDIWEEPVGGREIYTYTIITTQPNETVGPIHDRMPVILEPQNEAAWLDQSATISRLHSLLKPSVEKLRARPS